MKKINKILMLILVVTAGLCLYIVTPYGLATSPDSVGYLKSAEGLIDGLGFNYFNPQWPPLYPINIALFSWVFELSVSDGARLLNCILVPIIIYLISNYDEKNKQIIWVIFAAQICIHPLMTHIYFYAWSETMLFGIILINFKYLEKLININNECTKKFVLINIILISCSIFAFMTRYAGITILITNTLMILVFGKEVSFWVRIRLIWTHIIIFALIVSVWFIYTFLNFKTFSNRSIKLHPPEFEQIKKAIIDIGGWYLPEYLKFDNIIYACIGVALIIFIIKNVLTATVNSKTKKLNINIDYTILIFSAFSIIYLFFIMMSMLLIDVAIPLDNRILSPVFLSVAICLFKELSNKINQYKIKYFLLLYALMMTISSLVELKDWSMLSRYNGIELSSKDNRKKVINQFLKDCDKNIKIISDMPWEFNLYTKAKIDWLPRVYDMTSGKINKEYKNQINELYAIYSIIIVGDLKSEYMKEINDTHKFNSIYLGKDGALWINKNILEDDLCN